MSCKGNWDKNCEGCRHSCRYRPRRCNKCHKKKPKKSANDYSLLSLLDDEGDEATDPEGVVNEGSEPLNNGLEDERNDTTDPEYNYYSEEVINKVSETLNNGNERNDATDSEYSDSSEEVVNKVFETMINGLKELRNEATHPVGVFDRVFETLNNKGEVNVNVNVNGLKKMMQQILKRSSTTGGRPNKLHNTM